MSVVLVALLPIIVILVIGKVMASTQVLSAEGWIGLERVTYFLLFPALIVSKLAVADFSQIDWRMPVVLVAAQIGLSLISLLWAYWLRVPRAHIGVYIQSAARWNTFIALALANEILGAEGVALVALAATVMIPIANLISVSALMRFADADMTVQQLVQQVAINPLVIACALGIGLNLSGVQIPGQAMHVLDLLGQATIALGLLATGAAVRGRGAVVSAQWLVFWSALRLIGLPVIAVLLGLALQLSPQILLIILISTAVPTAANGAILARQLGADANLAANLIANQTVLALLTIAAGFWIFDAFAIWP
jgi:hypothetical protein